MVELLVYMNPYAEVQPTEPRLSEIDDINVENWTLVVKNPKGREYKPRRGW